MIELKDTFKKTVGVLTSAIFTMIGMQMAFKGFIKVFISVFIIFIAIIIALAVLLWIPFLHGQQLLLRVPGLPH